MLNTSYINNLTSRINGITNCTELAQVSQEAMQYFTELENSLLGQISLYESLVIPPTDLGSAIAWINKMISTFSGPYAQAISMQAQIIALKASILSLISSRLGTLSCSRYLSTDLNTIMRVPRIGVSLCGLSTFGGG